MSNNQDPQVAAALEALKAKGKPTIEVYRGFVGINTNDGYGLLFKGGYNGQDVAQAIYLDGPAAGLETQVKAKAGEVEKTGGERLSELKKIAAARYGWTPPSRPQQNDNESPVLVAKLGRTDAGVEVIKNLKTGNVYVTSELDTDKPLGTAPLVPELQFVDAKTVAKLDEDGKPIVGKYVAKGRWVIVAK